MSDEAVTLLADVAHTDNLFSSPIFELTLTYYRGYFLAGPKLLRLGHIFSSIPTSRQNLLDNPN